MPRTNIAVVPELESLHEAYHMGYDRFADADTDYGEFTDTVDGPRFEAVDIFQESAEWANQVAPRLRALSGFVDSGPGTYTVERDAAVVPVGNEDDLPRDAVRMASDWVYEALVQAYRHGALDAIDGIDPDPASTEHIL